VGGDIKTKDGRQNNNGNNPIDHAHDDGNTLPTAMTVDNDDDDTSFKHMRSDYESDEESSDASPHSYPRLGIDTDNESDEESSNASPISCACPPGIPDEIQSLKPTRRSTVCSRFYLVGDEYLGKF
jgi:hypothetical protein